MNVKNNRSRGETIIEILAAMTILTLIITSVYSILLRASKTNTSVKNRVIALNYAREGVEGVRNIRDTNWLRYSGDRRNKWLCRDAYYKFGAGVTQNDCTSGPAAPYTFVDPIPNEMLHQQYKVYTGECSDKIQSGYYILERSPSFVGSTGFGDNNCNRPTFGAQYILEPRLPFAATETDLETNRDLFRLFYDGTESDLVHHSSAQNLNCASLPCVAGALNKETPFYRRIKINVGTPFEDPDTGAVNDPNTLCNSAPCNEAKISITSVVEWEEEGQWEYVELEGQLFDFYERSDY